MLRKKKRRIRRWRQDDISYQQPLKAVRAMLLHRARRQLCDVTLAYFNNNLYNAVVKKFSVFPSFFLSSSRKLARYPLNLYLFNTSPLPSYLSYSFHLVPIFTRTAARIITTFFAPRWFFPLCRTTIRDIQISRAFSSSNTYTVPSVFFFFPTNPKTSNPSRVFRCISAVNMWRTRIYKTAFTYNISYIIRRIVV